MAVPKLSEIWNKIVGIEQRLDTTDKTKATAETLEDSSPRFKSSRPKPAKS